MAVIVDVSRFVTAAVFVVAGGAKFADQPGTRRALGEFGVAKRLRSAGAVLLPCFELLVAALLIIEGTSWIGGVAALAAMGAFTAAVGAQLGRGRHPDCHCFGRLQSAPIGAGTLWRNLVLGIPPLIVVLWG